MLLLLLLFSTGMALQLYMVIDAVLHWVGAALYWAAVALRTAALRRQDGAVATLHVMGSALLYGLALRGAARVHGAKLLCMLLSLLFTGLALYCIELARPRCGRPLLLLVLHSLWLVRHVHVFYKRIGSVLEKCAQ
jgi:hypothetical protein